MKSNYDLVLEVIENYDDEEILNDFKDRFIVGENISKEDYFKFCTEYNSDCSDDYYVKLNWKYIESGGDVDVFE